MRSKSGRCDKDRLRHPVAQADPGTLHLGDDRPTRAQQLDFRRFTKPHFPESVAGIRISMEVPHPDAFAALH